MSRDNRPKRIGGHKMLIKLLGEEQANILVEEGWVRVYSELRYLGYTWSERDLRWVKSIRPTVRQVTQRAPLKQYDYARITFNCYAGDVDVLVEQWSTLVDIVNYAVWRVEDNAGTNPGENVRVTVFIRRVINED